MLFVLIIVPVVIIVFEVKVSTQGLQRRTRRWNIGFHLSYPISQWQRLHVNLLDFVQALCHHCAIRQLDRQLNSEHVLQFHHAPNAGHAVAPVKALDHLTDQQGRVLHKLARDIALAPRAVCPCPNPLSMLLRGSVLLSRSFCPCPSATDSWL